MTAIATIREARVAEASVLSALALRSKAVWGYDKSFLDACRSALTVTEDDVADGVVGVLEIDGAVVGFYRVHGEPPEGELCDLWVEPDRIRRGAGTLLLEHALAEARRRGLTSLLVESDPHAESFYASHGATRIGERESTVAQRRFLPLLRFHLEKGDGEQRRGPSDLRPVRSDIFDHD